MYIRKLFNNWEHGVINDIEETAIPITAAYQSQGLYYKENMWRKIPGLNFVNPTAIDTESINGIFKFRRLIEQTDILVAQSGNDLYAFNPENATFSSFYDNIQGGADYPISFFDYGNNLYFGGPKDQWRRWDGGLKTYSIGENNGDGATAIRKFGQVIFNAYANRFMAIGWPENPDYLMWSALNDYEGIERWEDSNVQVSASKNGDFPLYIDILDGKITMFNRNSISGGNVRGVPQNWTFQTERYLTGTISGRTVKRYGNQFYMLTPDFELYRFPDNKLLSKGRVKFAINPYRAHRAVAEILDNRYYVIAFESNEAVSSNKYHMWYYDILGDRFYGPHKGFNVTSMFWDFADNMLLMGGSDNLAGHVFQHRGRNIADVAMACDFKSAYTDFGNPHMNKRFEKFKIRCKQEGTLSDGAGQLEAIVNTNYRYDNPQSQRLTLQDQYPSMHLTDTGETRALIEKRAYIHDQYGRGTSIQVELKHEVKDGDFSFPDFEVEYYEKARKENWKNAL